MPYLVSLSKEQKILLLNEKNFSVKISKGTHLFTNVLLPVYPHTSPALMFCMLPSASGVIFISLYLLTHRAVWCSREGE